MSKHSEIKEKIESLLKKKDEQIGNLKAELASEKSKPNQEVFIVGAEKLKLPEVKVPPFPEKMKVDGALEVSNFPEKQKVELLKPAWWKDPIEPKEFPKKMAIDWENVPREKQEKPNWVDGVVISAIEAIGKLFTKLWKVPIKTERTEVDRLKPQMVVIVDGRTGKPLSKEDLRPMVNVETRVPPTGSGSSSASEATSLGDGRVVVDVENNAKVIGSAACKTIFITALIPNSDVVVVGGAGIVWDEANRTGKVLYAGDSITISINNLNKVYVNGKVGDGVSFTYTN